MRKLIAFDEETYVALIQLGRRRMANLQDLADEAFADLLAKHGVPIDLRAALRQSASLADDDQAAAKPRKPTAKKTARKKPAS